VEAGALRPVAPPVAYTCTADGGHVGYQVFGEGAFELLNLKEWGASIDAVWEHPVHLRLLQYWGSAGRCVSFDPRGAGVSDPVEPDQVGDVGRWVEDALAAMNAADVSRVVVLGEGFGAHAAVALSVAHPERVETLVLLNPYPSLTRSQSRAYGLPAEGIDRTVEFVRHAWGTGQVVAGDVPAFGGSESFLDFCGRFERAAASPATAARWVRAAFTSDVSSLLSRVSVRTLVLYSGDLAHVPIEASRDVADRVSGARFIEMTAPSFYWFDDPETTREFNDFVFGSGVDERGTRELATVVFVDIVDSTGQAAQLGDNRWEDVLNGVDAFVRSTVERFGGRLVKQTGDGHLASFAVPSDALRAALAISGRIGLLGVEIRTGVNTGEVQVRPGGDLSGIGVHVAARTMAAANPGEILVTESVPALVAGSGFAFNERGTHQLKGIPGDWRLLALTG
jgi:class 3 adenylate cyclase/pimeloyl-ACP methyl ester carboxylesterase